ncbi:MAG TPA: SagB family peptide dehydrogenase [Nostocaceae cyanobacterium]|nr:SagB family peptide dehydrogenase [Nostocaceae cyanobacterium]
MQPSLTISFKKDIHLQQSESSIVLQTANGALEFKDCSTGLQKVLHTLANEGGTEEYFSEFLLKTEGLQGLAKFNYYLKKFIDIGIICYKFYGDGLLLAIIIPILPGDKFIFQNAEKKQKYVLSRFAYCHNEQKQMLLESPLSHTQIVLSDWRGGALISSLAQPQSCHELSNKIPNISESVVQTFLGILLSVKILHEFKEEEQLLESEALAQWEFHDLLFHTKSRKGRQNKTFYKTFRFQNIINPLPAIKPQISNEIVPLYSPDIQSLKKLDRPFTWVLEERKSIYKYGNKPLTENQLGEFLYRSARVRNILNHNLMEYSNRPYPSGGAGYGLEIYVTVNVCDNISPGLYHYCPQKHQLSKVCIVNNLVKKLLKEASSATGKEDFNPQVLIILAARFPRVSWVYESVAYALILKEVGVLLQTMYLVATAMNLAPCALGSGNTDLFAEAAGTDYYAESSVGEFILGSQAVD